MDFIILKIKHSCIINITQNKCTQKLKKKDTQRNTIHCKKKYIQSDS